MKWLATLISALLLACTSANADQAAQGKTNYLTRDVTEDVFYFVMPDRFNNGDKSNDLGAPKGSISHGGLDPSSKWAFHGGDIKGLEQKLDYLDEMGITAIWMTPILRNKAIQNDGFAHHGYWIVDFTEIDPHFGSNADLKHFIAAAHKRDIKVFFDIITNHTADIHKYRECHNDDGTHRDGKNRCEYKSLAQLHIGDTYTPFVPEHEQNLLVPAWLNNTEYFHNQGDSTFEGENSLYGDFNGLDDLNTEHPDVVAGMIDIYKNLITEFKPDGFRVDTVRHVQLPFWQTFTPAIIAHAKALGIPNFHVFGEVYDPDPKTLSTFTTEGKLPAVLDFGFQKAVGDVFFTNAPVSTISDLLAQDHLYNDDDSSVYELLTFLGNHDMGRTGHFINKGVPEAPEAEKLARSKLAHAMMFFSRGIPVIYYGDEQGFTGDGHDVDAREDMMPSNVASYIDNKLLGSTASVAQDNFDNTHPLYQWIKQMSALRAHFPALQSGEQVVHKFDDENQMFSFTRKGKTPQDDIVLVFNASTKLTTTELTMGDHFETIAGNGTLSKNTLTLPALSFAMLHKALSK